MIYNIFYEEKLFFLCRKISLKFVRTAAFLTLVSLPECFIHWVNSFLFKQDFLLLSFNYKIKPFLLQKIASDNDVEDNRQFQHLNPLSLITINSE